MILHREKKFSLCILLENNKFSFINNRIRIIYLNGLILKIKTNRSSEKQFLSYLLFFFYDFGGNLLPDWIMLLFGI